MRRRRMTRPPEEMKTSAKEGSLMDDCSLKTAILRAASSGLAKRERSAGMSAWSMAQIRGGLSGEDEEGEEEEEETRQEGQERRRSDSPNARVLVMVRR